MTSSHSRGSKSQPRSLHSSNVSCFSNAPPSADPCRHTLRPKVQSPQLQLSIRRRLRRTKYALAAQRFQRQTISRTGDIGQRLRTIVKIRVLRSTSPSNLAIHLYLACNETSLCIFTYTSLSLFAFKTCKVYRYIRSATQLNASQSQLCDVSGAVANECLK